MELWGKNPIPPVGSAGFFFGLRKQCRSVQTLQTALRHLVCKARKRFRGLLRLLRGWYDWNQLNCIVMQSARHWEPGVFLQHLFGASSCFGSSFGGVDHGKTRNASDHLQTPQDWIRIYIFPGTETISYLLYSECGNTGSHCTSIPNAPCCKTSKSGQFSSASLSLARSKFSKSFHSSHFSDSESLISTLKVVSHEEGLHN